MMLLPCRSREVIELDSYPVKGVFDRLMIALHDLLRRDSFLACGDGDRRAMLVRSTDIDDVLSFQPEKPNEDIGRQICACNVTYMQLAIGIGECACDNISHCLSFKYSSCNLAIKETV